MYGLTPKSSPAGTSRYCAGAWVRLDDHFHILAERIQEARQPIAREIRESAIEKRKVGAVSEPSRC
jgi:hypothetical protein